MADSARVGVALVDEAIVDVSDMPDTSGDSFSWEGHCWELVTDPDLDTALLRPGGSSVAQDRFVARIANILRLNVQNLVVTEGATINHLVALAIAGATADFQEAFIQNLRTSGAVIDEAVIGDLATNIITSGLFRTADAGQRLEIDSNGLVMYGLDGDGVEYELVRIGPSGGNLLTIGETTVASDSVSAPRGSFEELTIGGEDLAALFEPLPRGRVAQNRYLVNSSFSDRTQSRLSTQFTVEPFRRYRIVASPFYLQAQAASGVEYKIVYSWDQLATTWDDRTIATGRSQLPDANAHTVPGLEADLPTSNDTGPRDLYVTLLVRPSTSPVRVLGRADYPPTLSVDDLGVRADDVGSHWTVGNVTEGSTPPPPATPTLREQSYTWTSSGYGGDISAGEVVQGYYSGVGMRSGGWVFPSGMRTTLMGAHSIQKVSVYLYATHWWSSQGGTAVIRPNDGTYKGTIGGTSFEVPRWPRGAGRWITLPASWLPHFKSGLYRGISVQTSSTSTTYYGRFRGTGAKLAAWYTTSG